jgi:CBS-domain-containing membrane protein
MNPTIYKKWLQEKLIPNLKPSSVIVVNNVSYHNVQINQHPTSKARKVEMLSYTYSSNMTKLQLYDLVKMLKPQHETFAIDGLLPSMDIRLQ